MTIHVTWQLIVTLDSIRNSCDVWHLPLALTSGRKQRNKEDQSNSKDSLNKWTYYEAVNRKKSQCLPGGDAFWCPGSVLNARQPTELNPFELLYPLTPPYQLFWRAVAINWWEAPSAFFWRSGTPPRVSARRGLVARGSPLESPQSPWPESIGARDGHADPNANAHQMRIDAHLMRISAYNAKKIFPFFTYKLTL